MIAAATAKEKKEKKQKKEKKDKSRDEREEDKFDKNTRAAGDDEVILSQEEGVPARSGGVPRGPRATSGTLTWGWNEAW